MKKIGSNVIEFRHREANAAARAVGSGGGGMSSGGNGSHVERRFSRLEAAFGNLRDEVRADIRLLLAVCLSGGVLLFGAIVASHLRLQDEVGTTRLDLRAQITDSQRHLQEEISGTRTRLQDEITGTRIRLQDDLSGARTRLEDVIGRARQSFEGDIHSLRAKDDLILEKLGDVETNLAILVARNDERAASRSRRAAP
jgi:hypothetical protein